jgi:hypothetical protein
MTGEGSEGTEMDVYKIDAEFLYEDQPHASCKISTECIKYFRCLFVRSSSLG